MKPINELWNHETYRGTFALYLTLSKKTGLGIPSPVSLHVFNYIPNNNYIFSLAI